MEGHSRKLADPRPENGLRSAGVRKGTVEGEVLKKILEYGLLIAGMVSYFGFVYPELILQEDAYLLVEKEGMEYQIPYEEAKRLFLWDKDRQERPVRIKCRITEYVYQVKENLINKKD